MPSGTFLTATEQALVFELHDLGFSNTVISLRLQRSAKVVRNCIRLGPEYGKRKKNKGNTKITNRDKHKVFQLGTAGASSAASIADELQLPVGKRRVGQILKETNMYKFAKKKTRPALKPHHKVDRIEWGRKHMSWDVEWTNVIFSDEKKFNLDGPDGFSHYWHDLRTEQKFRFSRNFGGGTLMVWAAFAMNGKTPLMKITTRMNSDKYTELMEEALLPFIDGYMDENCIYQQDNAAIHVSRESKAWFAANDIELLDWPPCSPDLNPIENLWGILARAVYKDGRQFENLRQLEECVKTAWRQIPQQTIDALINSMPGRVFEVIRRNGMQLDK